MHGRGTHDVVGVLHMCGWFVAQHTCGCFAWTCTQARCDCVRQLAVSAAYCRRLFLSRAIPPRARPQPVYTQQQLMTSGTNSCPRLHAQMPPKLGTWSSRPFSAAVHTCGLENGYELVELQRSRHTSMQVTSASSAGRSMRRCHMQNNPAAAHGAGVPQLEPGMGVMSFEVVQQQRARAGRPQLAPRWMRHVQAGH